MYDIKTYCSCIEKYNNEIFHILADDTCSQKKTVVVSMGSAFFTQRTVFHIERVISVTFCAEPQLLVVGNDGLYIGLLPRIICV